ncbi:right-handed parallel beta-helix repeat-containing protein [Sedimentitalea sp. JM2-8]|uniref:Right-handed parallel beta-helix repeat-containing protein n=1 Tax=Sedimentitalea xiamensis TaxID=3050037 RepID=A0ABT7FHK6_9RHOB|nr:LamG-like jellyroll fold domain-containing protein [Sedimentitalea xiamensis]MDK3074563.1 right-handed parallel beta-helix repeat-containing protein [Sedimentitalea xiamensis]
MALIQVRNTAEFKAALKQMAAGDTIALAPGTYDWTQISPKTSNLINDPDRPVTITSQDPGDPAVVMGIFVDYTSNLIFDNLDIRFEIESFGPQALGRTDLENIPDSATYPIRIDHAENITVQNSRITGEISEIGVAYDDVSTPSPSGKVIGLPSGGHIKIDYSKNVTVKDSDISLLTKGIRANGVDGLTIENNEIHDLRSSPIGGGNVDNVIITGNKMYDITPRFVEGYDLDHADFIHFFPRPGIQDGAQENYVITDNVMLQGSGAAILGIYLDDNSYGLGYKNVLIENNLIHNGDTQGIRLEYVTHGEIKNNTLVPADNEFGGVAIIVRQNSHDLDISNNVVSAPTDYMGEGGNIVESGTVIVQRLDSSLDNYLGDLFSNPFDSHVDLEDLQVIPGSSIDIPGLGASITWLPQSSATGIGIIAGQSGDGLESLTHVFEVPLVIGPNGQADLTRATYLWDFGDGTTSHDAAPSHVFGTVGLTEVTVKIALTTGQTVDLARTFDVRSPIALSLDAAAGVADGSAVVNAHELLAGDPLTTISGRAVFDASRPVEYQVDDSLRNNDSYSVTLDFMHGDATAGSATLISLVGGFRLDVSSSSIWGFVGSYDTDTGEKRTDWIKLPGQDLADTDWHNLTLTYSAPDGEALLYLDGTEVYRTEGLDGFRQYTVNGHDLILGNAGNAAQYYIDDVHILNGALSAEQVAEIAGGKSIGEVLSGDAVTRPDPEPTPDPDEPDGSGGDGGITPPDPVPLPAAELALSLDAAAGVADGSAVVNAHELLAGDPLTTVAGRAVFDASRPVEYQVDDSLRNNDSYSVTLDFKHGDATAGSATLISLVGGFRLDVSSSSIWGFVGSYDTDTGEKRTDWIKLPGQDLADTDWHNLTLTYSAPDGEALLYLDGTEVYRTEGLDGFRQYTVNGHDLILGNAGNAAQYYIDDVHILNGALSAEQVAEIADAGDGTQLSLDDGTVSVDSITMSYATETRDLTVDLADTSANTGAAQGDLLEGIANLTGGGGADTFIYADGGADVITDFDSLDTLWTNSSIWGGNRLSTAEVMEFARVVSGDTVFDFGIGNTLTLEDYMDLSNLTPALTLL